jgi:DNA polymerase III alpha subunit (gram-positive type)
MLIDLDLIYDCESTGLKRPDSDYIPDLVQLSAKLVIRRSGRVVVDVTRIVKPSSGVAFEAEAIEHHRITEQLAHQVGCPLPIVLADFRCLAENATAIIAHHINFDRAIISGACARANAHALWWDHCAPKMKCTMELCTPIIKLPGQFGEPKYPTLEECHHYWFPERAWRSSHDARDDRDACADVWVALLERGIA